MNVILIESAGKILGGIVGTMIFLRWVAPAIVDGVRKTRQIAAALSNLGPFMERTDKLAQEFPKLAARVARIEEAVGPNGGKSLFDSQTRVEADLAFLKEAMALDQATPVFRATPEGQYEWVNDRYAELVDMVAEDLLGNGWVSAVCEKDRGKVMREWESAVQQQRRFSMTFSVIGQDAREVLVYCRAFPLRLHGEPRFFVGRIEPVAINSRGV